MITRFNEDEINSGQKQYIAQRLLELEEIAKHSMRTRHTGSFIIERLDVVYSFEHQRDGSWLAFGGSSAITRDVLEKWIMLPESVDESE